MSLYYDYLAQTRHEELIREADRHRVTRRMSRNRTSARRRAVATRA